MYRPHFAPNFPQPPLTSSGALAVSIMMVSGILLSSTERSSFRFEHNRAIPKNEVPRLGRVVRNRRVRGND